MEYTHNLKIILIDNNSIIEDKHILNEIKNILSENITHKIEWNGQLLDITIKWDKKELSEIDQTLIGDLFSYPIYHVDRIILNHTQKTISHIDCKYIIEFYISKMLCDTTINQDTIGFI